VTKTDKQEINTHLNLWLVCSIHAAKYSGNDESEIKLTNTTQTNKQTNKKVEGRKMLLAKSLLQHFLLW